jgi:class 3 adenylate cyclase
LIGKIGVSLGHRRKILVAIADLAGRAQSAPQAVRSEPKPQETAERRQVTVMFSDLVGSTALSARMDPEDLREVISAYQKCVAETVRRFGGFAKYMGDGVLVYFGYPQAHEDDAERAVQAGLGVIQAVGELKAKLTVGQLGFSFRHSGKMPRIAPGESAGGSFAVSRFHSPPLVAIRGRRDAAERKSRPPRCSTAPH